MIKTAYNNENTNLVFEIDRVDRVSIGNNAGIKEEYVGTLIDTSTSPDKKTENYRVQVKGFESNWTEVPSNTYTDPYVLPEATADTLGGVKIGSNVTVNDDGTISVASPFTLPIASDEVLGGIKIGSNLSIDENGVLSASGGGGGTATIHTNEYETETVNDSVYHILTLEGKKKGHWYVYTPENESGTVTSRPVHLRATDEYNALPTGQYGTYDITVYNAALYMLEDYEDVADNKPVAIIFWWPLNGSFTDSIYIQPGYSTIQKALTMPKADMPGISHLNYSPKTVYSGYASASKAGAIKVGSGLSIDGNGILSATGGGGGGGSILDLSDEFADWNNQTDPQTYEYPDYYKHTYTNTTAQTEHIAALVTAVTAAASSGAPLLISDSQMFESVESFYADQGFVGIQATLSFKALHDDDNYYYLEFYHINAQFHSYSDSYVEFYKGAQIKGESNNQT